MRRRQDKAVRDAWEVRVTRRIGMRAIDPAALARPIRRAKRAARTVEARTRLEWLRVLADQLSQAEAATFSAWGAIARTARRLRAEGSSLMYYASDVFHHDRLAIASRPHVDRWAWLPCDTGSYLIAIDWPQRSDDDWARAVRFGRDVGETYRESTAYLVKRDGAIETFRSINALLDRLEREREREQDAIG